MLWTLILIVQTNYPVKAPVVLLYLLACNLRISKCLKGESNPNCWAHLSTYSFSLGSCFLESFSLKNSMMLQTSSFKILYPVFLGVLSRRSGVWYKLICYRQKWNSKLFIIKSQKYNSRYLSFKALNKVRQEKVSLIHSLFYGSY